MKTIQIKVKPNARVSALEALPDGSYQARLKVPPVDGKANAELVALIAAHFGVAKSAINLKSGAASRMKRATIIAGKNVQ